MSGSSSLVTVHADKGICAARVKARQRGIGIILLAGSIISIIVVAVMTAASMPWDIMVILVSVLSVVTAIGRYEGIAKAGRYVRGEVTLLRVGNEDITLAGNSATWTSISGIALAADGQVTIHRGFGGDAVSVSETLELYTSREQAAEGFRAIRQHAARHGIRVVG